jgi:hypothetical protein
VLLDHFNFNVTISKINFLKLKKYYFNTFLNKKNILTNNLYYAIKHPVRAPYFWAKTFELFNVFKEDVTWKKPKNIYCFSIFFILIYLFLCLKNILKKN